jgi:hypothetical protein
MRVKELLIATRLCSTPLDCNRLLLLLLLLLYRLRVLLKTPMTENQSLLSGCVPWYHVATPLGCHCCYAVQAAGLKIPGNEQWLIFAPNNTAFADLGVLNKTGLTAQQLLEPANKQALTQVTCAAAGAGLQYNLANIVRLVSNSLRVLMLCTHNV